MRTVTVFLMALIALPAHAVVIRHDVDDANYRIETSDFPALVDIPGSGHGTLIAPQWVVTAAHTLPQDHALTQVTINGQIRPVERVIVHPGYKTIPQELFDQAMATGEAVLILTIIGSSDDIALIKLTTPATDVKPIALYAGNEEFGQTFRFIGKGATGEGSKGYSPMSSQRTELRHGFNKVTSAYDRWFCYQFDTGASALPLEAVGGNGDSGGPALFDVDGEWVVAGMMSWKLAGGDVRTANQGLYGQINCNVRISHYRQWIESEIASDPAGH